MQIPPLRKKWFLIGFQKGEHDGKHQKEKRRRFGISDIRKQMGCKNSLGTGTDGKPVIKQFSGKTEAIVKKKLRDFKKSDNYSAGHMPAKETVQQYFA